MSRALVIKGANFEANRVSQINFDVEKPCTAVEFTEDSYSPSSIETPLPVSVVKTPANTTDELMLTIADESVAKIQNGGIVAVGFGTTTITATCGNATATVEVNVSSLVYSPTIVKEKRIQQAGSSAWPGTIQPLQMSSGSSYDAFVGTDPDNAKHNKIATADGYSVMMIPAGSLRVKIKVITRTGWSLNMRYASTVNTASASNNYAGFVETAQVIDRDSHGQMTVSIPSGADSFAAEIGHNSSEYSVEFTFYNTAS